MKRHPTQPDRPLHYFEDPQRRESLLVEDVARHHWPFVGQVLGLPFQRQSLFTHLPKALYQKDGDVDIAVWNDPRTEKELLIAIEVKTLHLRRDGELKSQKPLKHEKQLLQLQEEGWDYVWLFDFIVTEPEAGWFHSQSFDGFDKHSKHVAPGFGHAVFQINAVQGRPEADAGSLPQKVLAYPERIVLPSKREELLNVFRKHARTDLQTVA